MEFKEQQAIQVIEEMITKTRDDIRENGFYFLLWGWLVLVAALANYYLLVFTNFTYHSAPWLLMPLGGILTAILSAREKNKAPKVKSYIEDLFTYVIRAFVITLVLICIFMPMGNQWAAFYPTIMTIYGIWLYVSGGILKFTPLMAGAFLNWSLAAAGFLWKDSSVHLLLMAGAVLGGYIIPGYMLNIKSKHADVQGA